MIAKCVKYMSFTLFVKNKKIYIYKAVLQVLQVLQIPKNPVFMRLSEKFKVLHCGVTSCYRCYTSKKKAIENPENVPKM